MGVTTFETNTVGRRFALCPWTARKGLPKDEPPPGSYTLKKLIRVRREFDDLQIDLLNFLLHLANAPRNKLLARSALRPDDLPTTQQIVAQMLEALGHRLLSARERKRGRMQRTQRLHWTLNSPRNRRNARRFYLSIAPTKRLPPRGRQPCSLRGTRLRFAPRGDAVDDGGAAALSRAQGSRAPAWGQIHRPRRRSRPWIGLLYSAPQRVGGPAR